jgi:cytochrome P450
VGLSTVYDPLDPATIDDPYPVYAGLREHDPVHWHEELGCWVLTRYDDCLMVLRDHARFARDRRRIGMPLPDSMINLQSLDPPEQFPLRGIFVRALHQADTDALRDCARTTLRRALERSSATGRVEFMADVAVPVALRVTCALLGVDEPDRTRVAADAAAIVRAMDAGREEEVYRRGGEARACLDAIVSAWRHDAEPGGVLARAYAEGAASGIPAAHITNTVRVVFLSGYMAMVSGLGNIMLTLLSRPRLLEQLTDPVLLRPGVDELLRYDSPVTGTTRFATQDTWIRGRDIRRGEGVLTLYAAANRDPERFERPDEILLDRQDNSHLGYSWGAHACTGKPFAQLILEDLVSEVARIPGGAALAAEPTRRPTATLRGVDSLPLLLAEPS